MTHKWDAIYREDFADGAPEKSSIVENAVCVSDGKAGCDNLIVRVRKTGGVFNRAMARLAIHKNNETSAPEFA